MPERKIKRCFDALRERREKGFIAYITAGDPSLEATRDRVLMLDEVGVDIVELGVPFSDPLADGRVNQDAAARALAAGASLRGVIELVRAIRKDSAIPLVLYTYMNPLMAYGFNRVIHDFAHAGVDGLLVLDLAYEESGAYRDIFAKNELDQIFLITPTTPDDRITRIVRHATGFVYCVSRTGVTGVRTSISNDARSLVKRIQAATPLPVALGFGISTPEQAHATARYADAVVVGSAIVQRLHETDHAPRKRKQAVQWIRQLVEATKS